ncbi:MAG TPA: molybdopterin cofactor-binding domain-containing protein [Thermoanaerobaculia bacterium]|nr:molybdopterin cofactor-binding domain-containing protein [Thermoanaerobaculia bacterium]
MSASRRDFLRWSAFGGAALVIPLPLLGKRDAAGAPASFAPNQWLRVGADGRVTLVIARSEMGQGVRTCLAMILADELEAEWPSISIEQASPGPLYEDLNTGGSDSVESSWMVLRRAAAAAREMLIAAAAAQWQAKPAECRAENGSVLHAASARRLPFGRLAAAAARLPVPKEPVLKDPKDFRLIGTKVRRIDGPDIVTGRARYGFDTRLQDALFAAIARCPVAGGRPRRFDASKAKAVAGVVQVAEISAGIAVIARDSYAALSGRDALAIEWDEGPNAALTTAELTRRLDAAASGASHVSRREGDADKALAGAAARVSGTYRDAFQAHAQIEPMNACARVSGGSCEIWAPTQNPQRVQKESAKLLGIPPERVTVHVTLIGGGFGRRLGADYATEAAEVARAAGKPVHVVWSRRDDFEHDRLHPAGRADLEAGLDSSGRIVAWKHRFTTFHLSMFGPFNPKADEPDVSPWGGYDNPYNVPNQTAEWNAVESPIHTGAWRSVDYPVNVFARECLLDEIAHKASRDPVELRRDLLTGEFPFVSRKVDRGRLRAVVDLAAAKSGWGSPLAPIAGRRVGRGIACNVYHGRTALAHVAEVSVGEKEDVRVHRIVCAADCGLVVNPLGLEGQVESGVAWGLSYALKGEITIERGRVAQASYRDFPVLGIAEMPRVEVHTIASTARPTGFGEQPVPPVAPAVANAIFAATGRRLYRLPIRPEDIAG